jgi:hypothetical protein
MTKVRKIPQRQCIACRNQRPKRELVRIVRNAEGHLLFDPKGKLPGRGAYLCVSANCLHKAIKENLFARHLNSTPDPALLAELEHLIGDQPD